MTSRPSKTPSKASPVKKKPAAESDSVSGHPGASGAPGASNAAPPPDRAALVRRMWSAADLHVREIEQRLRDETPAPDDRERDARVLSVLAKTLRELSELDAHNPDRENSPDDDDAVPRDLDELRRSLVRKLEALVAGSAAGASGDT